MAKRTASNKAISNLMNWADRPQWTEEQTEVLEAHLELVCERMGIDQGALLEMLEQEGYIGMLFGVVFEDFLGRSFPPGDRNLVDDYLKRRGWRETPPGRRYLQQLRDSTLSLYEVVDVSPGKHCDVRDLVRDPEGEAIRVFEQMGTQNLRKWDRIAARVLRVNKRNEFSGGILPFPLEPSQTLLRMLGESRRLFDEKVSELDEETRNRLSAAEVPDQLLQSSCVMFTSCWLSHVVERLSMPMPDLVNRDGESLVFYETRFPIIDGQDGAIAERLDAAREWQRDEPGQPGWAWIAGSAEAGSGDGIPVTAQRIDGSLDIRDHALVFSTNSESRSTRGQAALEALLQDLIGPGLSRVQTPQQMLAARDAQGQGPAGPRANDEIDPELAAEAIRSYLDQHYRQCLDEPVPMLDNRTPRECAASETHRGMVIDWLKHLENSELHRAQADGQAPYDFGWIWKELGLSET